MTRFKASLSSLIPLLAVKPLKLHFAVSIFAAYNLLKEKSVRSITLILLFLPLISYFQLLFDFELNSFIRTTQLVFIILTFDLILKKVSFGQFVIVIRVAAFLAVIFVLFDLFLSKYEVVDKEFFGLNASKKYAGITGESNFSALFLTGFVLMSAYLKRYYLLIFFLPALYMTNSRGAFVAVILFAFLTFLSKIKLKEKLKSFFLGLVLFVMSIGTILTSELLTHLDSQSLRKLKYFSSERIPLQKSHYNQFKDNPFGVGYFRGRENLDKYFANYNNRPFTKRLEAHNLFLQVMGELGVQGFLVLMVFLSKIFLFLDHRQQRYLVSFLSMLYFLNSLHEIIFYIFIIFMIRAREDQLDKKLGGLISWELPRRKKDGVISSG